MIYFKTSHYLVDVCFAGCIHSLLQFGCIDFDIFTTKGLAGLGQVLTSFWRSMYNNQLPRLHLVYNLLNGVSIWTALVVYVSDSRSGDRRMNKLLKCLTALSGKVEVCEMLPIFYRHLKLWLWSIKKKTVWYSTCKRRVTPKKLYI